MTTADRFNDFHLAVACASERLRFALEALESAGADAVGCGVLRVLLDDLDALVEAHADIYPPRLAPVLSLVDPGRG